MQQQKRSILWFFLFAIWIMNRYKNIIYFFHSLLQNTIYDHNHLQKGRRKRICMRPNINASWAWWGFGFLIHHVWYICNAYFLINLWYEKTNTLSTIMCLLQVTSSIRLNAFLTFNDFAKNIASLKSKRNTIIFREIYSSF